MDLPVADSSSPQVAWHAARAASFRAVSALPARRKVTPLLLVLSVRLLCERDRKTALVTTRAVDSGPAHPLGKGQAAHREARALREGQHSVSVLSKAASTFACNGTVSTEHITWHGCACVRRRPGILVLINDCDWELRYALRCPASEHVCMLIDPLTDRKHLCPHCRLIYRAHFAPQVRSPV